LVVIDQHDAIALALVTGAGRTYRHAWRVFAMQAGLREMHGFGERKAADFESLNAVEEGTARPGAVRILIRQAAGIAGRVPRFAAGHAGVTADTDIQVDNESQLRHL